MRHGHWTEMVYPFCQRAIVLVRLCSRRFDAVNQYLLSLLRERALSRLFAVTRTLESILTAPIES